jgi:hypothetical protein
VFGHRDHRGQRIRRIRAVGVEDRNEIRVARRNSRLQRVAVADVVRKVDPAPDDLACAAVPSSTVVDDDDVVRNVRRGERAPSSTVPRTASSLCRMITQPSDMRRQ